MAISKSDRASCVLLFVPRWSVGSCNDPWLAVLLLLDTLHERQLTITTEGTKKAHAMIQRCHALISNTRIV